MATDGISEPKIEKDWSKEVDEILPKAVALAKESKLQEALEQLLTLEKQTRSSADVLSNGRVLVQIVTLIHDAKDWKQLNEYVTLLSKKHGLLKGAVSKMVQQAMTYLESTPDKPTKLELIETLRTVTEGKIFVEVERARLTRMLSKIKEDEGNINDATEILHELQVETFGSMERREKTDFILEQMRLSLLKRDFTRLQIISRKISIKYFDDAANEDLKLRFYEIMIQHALHEENFLNVTKYYRQVYNSKTVKEDDSKWPEVLKNVVLFIVLSPYDNEQSDLIHRIDEDSKLAQVPQFKEFLKNFITHELMRWPKIVEIYSGDIRNSYVFASTSEEGKRRWEHLHKRVIEHNIRVIAKYYQRITFKRLTQLLDLSPADAEEYLSKLVVSKTIHARIDRPAGIITFVSRKDPNSILTSWSHSVNEVLELIAKTTHLIAKEEIVHSAKLSKRVGAAE
ncbi:PCI-domain-containing protein [Gonapodya prolifera JEL478]|uniref:PCI-domain-containing protein n=1 Tax=Gonapodya prolifera (strain JEL478) TaxID=1344416 RepID=A0A139AQ72_GONPJ|nr:PCI-domain-containing protein [Gonapodya prolifera JEL478]|eukprot:KXS18653.1 PCI-domain-containing protein [Gonapodya prolifera JEL478]